MSDDVQSGVHRIDRDRRPLYLRTVEAIVRLIETERLEIGATLPSEVELGRLLDVGRSTVREAMMQLENAGVVARRRGIGTVLVGHVHPPSLGLERLERLEDLAERQGWTCGTAAIAFTSATAEEPVAAELGLPVGSSVTLVTRTKTRDGEPLAVMESWVPDDALNRAALEAGFHDSLTGLMLETMPLRYARAAVSARVCPERCLARLELEPGTPVLVLQETFIGDGERRLAYNENFFIPERIRLETLRKPPRVNHG